ncbi:putative uracil permease [Fusarium austroafricanum]|uniref:Putative uracil permease n=1 Tax=Fusarium austroafricanum TaxID=2364996 RepID=A0A8H4KG20_9HYPO|nr:putative uracil permease [Fusarium austroafricanum]
MVNLPSRSELIAPFRSKEAFVNFVKTSETTDGQTQVGNSRWSNKDLEPTPPEHRNWTWYNLPLYWFSNQFSLVGWNTGASLIAVGLTWQQSFVSCVLGALLASLVVICMARPGVQYHIGFPVLARSSMGMYGAYFFIFIRAIVCIVWYGIQTFYAGSVLSVMLRCIFGSSWQNLTNSLSESADISSKLLLAFFLAWLMQFPFMWVHPRNIHYIFTVKGVTMPIAAFAIFGWCMVNGGGLNSMNTASKEAEAAASTTPLRWSIMSGINQPDLARYCQKTRDAGPLQGVSVFCASVVVFFLGLAATASMQTVYGEAYWNIWELLEAILDHHWNAGARAGVFFVALAFLLGVFATNFGANSIPFGSDMTGSYNIFMAPLCAAIIVDYAYVRRGNIHVPSCYDGSKHGLYHFWSGVNWVGCLAWVLGVTMGLPGLIGQYQPQLLSDASRYMYMMGWLLTFVTAGVVYAISVQFVNIRVFPAGRSTEKTWEWLAKDGREGFYDDEREGQVIYAQESPSGDKTQDELNMTTKADEASL